MKILLFGSSGLLGTAIEKKCQEKNIECIGLSHDDFEITSYRQINKMIREHKPDVVINTIALVGRSACNDMEDTFNINSKPVWYITKICKELDIILVQISTTAVFSGRQQEGYYTENSEPSPQDMYGASKLISEIYTRSKCNKYYIIRLPMLFGPRRNNSTSFIDRLIEWMITKDEVKIATDKIESYGYSYDIAETILYIINEKDYGIYHVGNYGKASLHVLAVELKKLLQLDVKIKRAKSKDFDTLPSMLGLKSIKIRPLRLWKDALNEYINTTYKE